MPDATINYWAVLVSALAAQVIGMAWYSNKFIAVRWMISIGWDPKNTEFLNKMKKQAAPAMGVGFVMSFIMAYVLAHFVDYVGVTTVQGGLELALWLWLGFVATVILTNVMYEVRPKMLFVINAGYYLAVLLAMGAILAAWQ